MRVTCSPHNRSEMQRLTRYAKDVRRELTARYGEAKFSSGIIDVHPAYDALASYEVTVPTRILLPVWAAIKRRRARKAA